LVVAFRLKVGYNHIKTHDERCEMKRILLAVGELAIALHTARQIRSWLRDRETSLTLLAVVPSEPVSPLSHAKWILEHTESVFTDASEQPGILVRVADHAASEICREAEQGKYDLLVLGLQDHPSRDQAIGETCLTVLQRCRMPTLVIPTAAQTGLTPQVLVIADRSLAASAITDWLITQFQMQQLNVILYASSIQESNPLDALFTQAGIRTQAVIQPEPTAEQISFLERDRRVRWAVVPYHPGTDTGQIPQLVLSLLAQTSCPVMLIPEHPGPLGMR
jgi:nucleotide-binding universal stress UspA family protein